jgi:SAM-dependent methyltransferase
MIGAKNEGYCHCCRSKAVFEITGPWLRDEYLCLSCRSIPRQRHLQLILDTYFPGWESQQIHESSPSNGLIGQLCPGYSYSFYFDEEHIGQDVNGRRCENLEHLTFADRSFDLFLTQDVFEHVFDPAKAAKEIMRVLKPGGAHVFTAPKHKGMRKSFQRAAFEGSRIVHFAEESYHGNPVGDGKALVTWDYGDDFEFLLNTWCGYPLATYITRDRSLGIDGEFLEVFVMRKPL